MAGQRQKWHTKRHISLIQLHDLESTFIQRPDMESTLIEC